MKDNKTKEKFIELRAKGLSYDSISKELSVSKQTLINWSKEFELELSNLRAVELESLCEQYLIKKEKKLEMLSELLEKVKKNLLERDLNDMDSEQIFELFMKLISSLENPESITFKEQSNSMGLDLFSINTKTWCG